ncbi:hypothetical protein [Roseimaritima multifibrata]|uniref:hypothetical protein n=1 Tax=Roseimaritima multifibrata TaxID=1930274 RepID=UPI001C54F747|nr:hypothetical protein [Roseimaritima multifibrata]
MVQVLPAYGEFTQTYYVKDGKPANELDALRAVMRDAKVLFSHLPTEQFGPLAI